MSESIWTSRGTFTAELSGQAQAPLVVLLHGFPLSRHSWCAQLPALATAGYRALAPDQRGYSPGVRPDPRALESYGIEQLVDDVLELADACGPAGAPFHVVGHDWGGQVAWCVAARHPERIRSLAVFSRPHPAAFRAAYQEDRDGQQERSRHHRAFHDPTTGPLLLADDARRLRAILAREKVPADAIERHLEVLGSAEAIEAALAWYRAAGTLTATPVGAVRAPTLYVWGDADSTVGPTAARATADWVTGPYRFELAPGVGHCLCDSDPELATRVLLEHLRSVR